jgi:hypothetical protein
MNNHICATINLIGICMTTYILMDLFTYSHQWKGRKILAFASLSCLIFNCILFASNL